MRKMRIIDNPDYIGGGIYYREHEKYMSDPELREAFECGKKEGWREAMIEAEEQGLYERRATSIQPRYRYNDRWEDDPYMERRRRRANGQFY